MLHQGIWFRVTKVRDRNTLACFDPSPWELGRRDEQRGGADGTAKRRQRSAVGRQEGVLARS